MKKILCLFFMILSCCAASAQKQHRIDSLQRALNDVASDTAKIHIYRQLATLAADDDLEAGLRYAHEAFLLADRYHHSDLKTSVLTDIGSLYRNKSDYRTAIRYFKKAIASQTDKENQILAATWFELGIAYLRITELDSSRNVLEKALAICLRFGDKHTMAGVLNCLGNVDKDQNDYKSATENYLKSTEIFQSINDQAGVTQTLSNLGNIQYLMGNYEPALQYALKSLVIAEAIDKKSSIAYSDRLLGRIYRKTGKFDEALKRYGDAIEIYTKLGARRDVGETRLNRGNIYFEKLQFPLAIIEYQRSLDVVRSIRDTANMVYSMAAIGMTFVEMNAHTKAFLYLDSALQFSKQTRQAHMSMDIYESLSQLRAKEKRFEDAYDYHQRFTAIKDSLAIIQNRDEAQELAARYQAKQQESEITTLNAQNEVKALQLEKSETGLKYLIGFVALCLLLLALIFNRYTIKRRTARKLEELDRMKSRFFSNISHEFRTPLSLIIGPLQQKLSTIQNIEEQQQTEVMLRNAHRLQDLINQLLDLSKIEAGEMKLKVAKGDPSNFLSLILPSFDSLAEQKKIKYQYSVCNSHFGFFDHDKVEKIINNLLSNAFKFTPSNGNVNVNCSIVDEHLKIAVADSGAGIPEDQIDKIFMRFYQLDDTTTRAEEGSGIGLALCKELTVLHRGKLFVTSKYGEGSTFNLEIPLAASQYRRAEFVDTPGIIVRQSDPSVPLGVPAESDIEHSLDDGVPMVLIAEDNDDMRKFVAKILEHDFNVVVVNNGAVAWEQTQSIIPDLIISDLMMPIVDGCDLCEKVKTHKATSHIPVVLLTARADQQSKLTGLKIGADDYLTKPFDPKELMIRVQNLIAQRKKLRALFSTEILLVPRQLTVTAPETAFINLVLEILESHYQDSGFGVEAFTEAVGLSRMQLHRKLKSITGKSPGDFLRQFRLERAQQLLQLKGMQVSQVAYDVGFNNLSNFTKAFKDFSGVTPSEYASRFELSAK